ncbi:MAG: cytochrome c3 family protein, partial [Actinomycetia bacterium]|nr:cytochrome c3 family protein [Actinomycetes bacterium]
ASEQEKLLPGQTISDFCFLCHDGTAASVDGDIDSDAYNATLGVYMANNIIYGIVPTDTVSRHIVNSNNASYTASSATSTIPLGSTLLQDFNGSETVLKCTSCHSPHGTPSRIVPTFNSKSAYPLSENPTSDVSYGHLEQNMILRNSINNSTITSYSGGWCMTCHDEAGDHITGEDHPVNTSTAYNWFLETTPPVEELNYYKKVTDSVSDYFEMWIFDHSWEATSGAAKPLCMSCHDDKIEVTNAGEGTFEDFDSFTYSDNFPHESANQGLLVEGKDDLCLNCHITAVLP